MKYSFFNRIRDLFLLCALLFLVKTASERTFAFVALHKNSVIHELNRDFIDHIYTTQRQLHFLEEHPIYANVYAPSIAEIKGKLATIEEKYTKNSPGLALLGPIGSAAIVAKEEQLQQKLLETINDLNKLLANIGNYPEMYYAAQTIHAGLEANKELLRTISA